MSKISPLWYVGGAAAAYFLFLAPKSATGTPVVSIPGVTSTGSTTVGINSGVKGGNGSFYTCSNYQQLLAANPNLGNPNYVMTAAEATQYIANYLDLQQAFPQWIAAKNQYKGAVLSTPQQCAQAHWNNTGCAEQRIFLVLSPPSTGAYVAPPAQPASSGSGGGFLSGLLGVATKVVPIVAAIAGDYNAPQLNDADLQALFTSAAIINDILPMYASADIVQVNAIDSSLNGLLKQYV